MMKDDLLTLTPMEDYEAPCLPTLEGSKPELLKEMPTRWKGKAMVATVAGLLGVATLTGCELYESLAPPNINIYTDYGYHHGGAGGGPIYVAYLTEQEAMGIIRNQLEQAGLNLDAPPPSGVIIHGEGWNEREIGIDLFDAENKIGVAVVHDWWWDSQDQWAIEIRDALSSYFAEDDIQIGVIFNQQNEAWDTGELEQLRQGFEAYLVEQTQSFIAHLQKEGIIE